MAKPNILQSRFAVDGSDADSAQIGAGPASGLRDTGYLINAIPTHNDIDYMFNRYYRWFQYLNAGQFEGASSFNSTLAVAGALTVGGTAIITGDVMIGGQTAVVADKVFTADNTTETFTSSSHGLRTGDGPLRVSNSGGALPAGLTAGTDYWISSATTDTFQLALNVQSAFFGTIVAITTNGTGIQTLSDTGSTLRVSDAAVTRDLSAARSVFAGLDLSANRNLTVLGTAQVTGGVTVGTNQHYTTSGTGRYKRGALVRPIPLYSSNGGQYTEQTNVTMIFPGNNIAEFNVSVTEGETITQILARVACGTVSAVTMKLLKIDNSGTTSAASQIGTSATSAGTSNQNETIQITGLSESVGGGFVQYALDFTMNNAGPVILRAAWLTTTIP